MTPGASLRETRGRVRVTKIDTFNLVVYGLAIFSAGVGAGAMYVHHEYVQKDLDAFLMFPVGAVVGVVVFGWIFFILALIGLVADALWGEVGALTIPILGVPLIVIATILLVRRKP